MDAKPCPNKSLCVFFGTGWKLHAFVFLLYNSGAIFSVVVLWTGLEIMFLVVRNYGLMRNH